jgi:hypothetical protein
VESHRTDVHTGTKYGKMDFMRVIHFIPFILISKCAVVVCPHFMSETMDGKETNTFIFISLLQFFRYVRL